MTIHAIHPLSFALLAALCGCAHADDPSRSATGTADASTAHPIDLSEADVAGLQARMASGQSSSLQLTRAYLQRIASIDRAGPRLNAVVELNPQAEADARALDAERKAGHVRGPLHGIPVLLKDTSTRCRWSTAPARWRWPSSVPTATRLWCSACALPVR